MWWQQVVPATAMMVCYYAPHIIVPLYTNWRFGNPWHPKAVGGDVWIEHFYHRDLHRSGDPWRPLGVDAIPDQVPHINI